MNHGDHSQRVVNFLKSERARPVERQTDEQYEAHREKIQNFIEGSGLSMVVLVEFPDGGFKQFSNRGMMTARGLGLLHIAILEHQVGMTGNRVAGFFMPPEAPPEPNVEEPVH